MTINGTIKMNMSNPMNVQNIDKRRKPVYCTDNGKRWASATDCAHELGVHITAIYAVCNGKWQTCKGLHFSYEENVSETQSKLAGRVSELESKQSELERKAALWDAYEKEQESIRKANEEREEALTKANKRLARHERMLERVETERERILHLIEQDKARLAELEGK